MKLGDQKQAIGLGVVALFAVGMLGKSAFGAFSSSNSNEPLVVKDIGGHAQSTAPSTQPAPSSTQSDPKEILTEPAQNADPSTIKREAFSKPELPAKTKSFNQSFRPTRNGNESYTKSDQIPPAEADPDSLQGNLSRATEPPSGEQGPAPTKESHPIIEKPFVRFDGFVEAGSAMAVITVSGKSFSVSIGDSIGFGYRIESISSQKLIIRKGRVVKTISIGKETSI